MSNLGPALKLIKKYEGCVLTPYLCPAGIPTIGYGTTFGFDLKPITMNHRAISEEEADALLYLAADDLNHEIRRLAKKELGENKLCALISFVYNIGVGAFSKSSLLKKVVKDDSDDSIEGEFLRWNKCGGLVMRGLTKRRIAEAKLYFS